MENESKYISWVVAVIMSVFAFYMLFSYMGRVDEDKTGYYKGKYEVLKEIKIMYMPAPVNYEDEALIDEK